MKTSMDNPTTMRYVESLSGFLYFARNLVRDLDPEEDFQHLRISAEKETFSQGSNDLYLCFFLIIH